MYEKEGFTPWPLGILSHEDILPKSLLTLLLTFQRFKDHRPHEQQCFYRPIGKGGIKIFNRQYSLGTDPFEGSGFKGTLMGSELGLFTKWSKNLLAGTKPQEGKIHPCTSVIAAVS